MTNRELITAVLKGERTDIIPCWGECPMDVTVFDGLLDFDAKDPVITRIRQAEFFDNSVCGVGIGLGTETIHRDKVQHTYRYETGAVWREGYKPAFFRDAVSFPINTPEEALKYRMPDAFASGRFNMEETGRQVNALHEAGYFVEGSVHGAWGTIYVYLTSIENIMIWMAIEPEAAHAVFDMTRKFSIDSARQLLACGVDCIFTGSDLGTGHSLMFSPAMFYEYVFPWLKELSELCHENGAFLHLHSHGHIQDVMDGIVEAGVDIINPVGPSDYNDLAMFKRRWGDRITLHGGISTTINRMDENEIQQHVEEVMRIGRKGGRFIPRTESGIPVMPLEKARFYIDTLKKERMHGYE